MYAMLAIKRSVGAESGVKRRNPLNAGGEARKQDIHPGFEIQGKRHQGYQWSHKTGIMSL